MKTKSSIWKMTHSPLARKLARLSIDRSTRGDRAMTEPVLWYWREMYLWTIMYYFRTGRTAVINVLCVVGE